MKEEILSELREKMTKTGEALKKEYKRIRTGRASTALLDGIKVDCYDTQMPLEQAVTSRLGDLSVICPVVEKATQDQPRRKGR